MVLIVSRPPAAALRGHRCVRHLLLLLVMREPNTERYAFVSVCVRAF